MTRLVEFRAAVVDDVVDAKRLIVLRAAPWEPESATVEYRGRVITETIRRGAFGGLERPGRVKLNRDHDATRLVGRGVEFDDRADGLIGRFVVAESPLGDESLALARIGAVSASVGMVVDIRTQIVTSTHRTVVNAVLDHVALVPQPAYAAAEVLSA